MPDRLKLPKLTVLIVTLNNGRSLETCLAAIRAQEYPVRNIEYLNVDGGSSDRTIQILKKYGFKTIKSPVGPNAEAQRGVGLKAAKHNLIVSLDADNYITDRKWLRKMVQPFIDDPSVVHAGTLHYHYEKNDAPFNRYNALFGAIDPIVFYVGIPDRVPWYKKTWHGGTIISRNSRYTTVDFSKETLPTVGCNGVVYKRDVLLKYAKSSPENFLHIDVFADLVEAGFTRFAIVDADVHHDTAISLTFLMKKRIAFLSSYYLTSSIKRRYLIYNPEKRRDRIRLGVYVLYTMTVIKPFFDALRGFIVLPDPAWFLHPIVCWVYLLAYGIATLKKLQTTTT